MGDSSGVNIQILIVVKAMGKNQFTQSERKIGLRFTLESWTMCRKKRGHEGCREGIFLETGRILEKCGVLNNREGQRRRISQRARSAV